MDTYIRTTYTADTAAAEARLKELSRLVADYGATAARLPREMPKIQLDPAYAAELKKVTELQAEMVRQQIDFRTRSAGIFEKEMNQRMQMLAGGGKMSLAEHLFGTPATLASVQRGFAGAFTAVRDGVAHANTSVHGMVTDFQSLLSLPGRLASSFLKLGESFIGPGAAEESTITSLAGMIAAGNAKGISTKQTIAGKGGKLSFFSNPEEEFRRAKAATIDLMQKMRVHARDLPGEFGDLMNVVQYGGLRGGLKAGRTLDEIEAMSARVMAVGKSLSIHSAVAGRDLGMLMDARAGSHNIFWTKIQGYMGMTAKEFNLLSDEKRWAALDKALKGFDFAIKDFETSWEAQSSTWEDYMKEIQKSAREPIFAEMKRSLIELNSWYIANREEILKTAKTIGGELAAAVKAVFPIIRSALEFAVQHRDVLLRVAEVWVGAKMLRGVGGMFGSPIQGNTIAAQMASFKAGGLGSWAQVGGNAVMGGAAALMFDSLINKGNEVTGVLGGFNKAIVAVEGAMSTLPGKFGLLGQVLLGIHQGAKWMARNWEENQDRRIKLDQFLAIPDEARVRFGGAVGFTDLSRRFRDQHYGGRGGPLTQEETRFYARARALAEQAKAAGALNEQGELTKETFMTALGGMGLSDVAMRRAAGVTASGRPTLGGYTEKFLERYEIYKAAVEAVRDATAREEVKAAKPAKANVNITNHNTLHQTLYEAEHPDRIMDSTAEMLEEMITRPLRHGVVIVTR